MRIESITNSQLNEGELVPNIKMGHSIDCKVLVGWSKMNKRLYSQRFQIRCFAADADDIICGLITDEPEFSIKTASPLV